MIFIGGAQQPDQRGWILWCSGSCTGPAGQDGGAGRIKPTAEFEQFRFLLASVCISSLYPCFLPQSHSDKVRVPRLTPVPAVDTYSIIGTHRFASKVIETKFTFVSFSHHTYYCSYGFTAAPSFLVRHPVFFFFKVFNACQFQSLCKDNLNTVHIASHTANIVSSSNVSPCRS